MAISPTIHRNVAILSIGLASLALAGCSLLGGGGGAKPTPTASEAPTEKSINIFDTRVGDCLNDADAGDVVGDVPLVDCDKPHDSEVFFVGTLPDGDYPGDDNASDAADALCAQPFIDFVGKPYETSAYDYTWYSPTAEAWGNGQREVHCVAVSDDKSKLTGTLAGVEK